MLGVRACVLLVLQLLTSRRQDFERRTQYDLQRRPAPAQQVDLDDLRVTLVRSTSGTVSYEFEHDCRCGDFVRFTEADLASSTSSITLACPSCSLNTRVLYTVRPDMPE